SREPSFALLISRRCGKGRKEPKIRIHRLKVTRVRGRNVRHETAMRRGGGRRDQRQSRKTTGSVDSCQSSHRGGIRVALDADQLPCKEEGAARLELKGIAQQLGRIDKGVAMQAAIAQKLRLLKTGNHAKHPLLFPVGQFSLESHEVVTRAMGVFRPKLYHGIGSR